MSAEALHALAVGAADPLVGLTVLQRGWLSSNNVLIHPAPGEAGAVLVDASHVNHAEQTCALVAHALNGQRLTRLVNTHLHSDHCGGNAALKAAHGMPISVAPGMLPVVRAWDQQRLTHDRSGQRCAAFLADDELRLDQPLRAGGRDWEVIAAPGHDPDSVMLFDRGNGVLISADALWENGFGVVFPEVQGEPGFDDVGAVLQLGQGMGAAADQAIGAEQLAGNGRWQVPLAQVHPVGLHRQGDVDPVVDQKQGAVGGAELAQGAGLGERLQVVEAGQVQPLGLSTADLSLTARDGVWSFAPRLVGRSIGEVSGTVQLRTAPQDRWPDADAALSGAVQARVPNLGVWSGWVPPGWRLQGEVVTTASLGGRFGAPQLTGELVAQRVSVRNLLQGVDYSDGELKVALRGDTARIERLSLRSGEGRITGEGVGEFGARPSARMQVRAESFRVLGRFDRQLVASGQAVLALQPEALKLDGRVVIDSGLFDLASRDAPTLDDDVTVRGGRGVAEQAPAAEPALLPRVIRQSSVNLDIDLGKKLRLRGRGLDTALQGELKLATPGATLAVNGSVRAQGGTYAAYGQKLNIERGIVSFTGRVDSPRLDILALRPNTDIRVGVAITGSPQSPRARLVSEPEMAESEKLSWLLLGRGSEGLGRTDTAVLQRAAVALLAGEGEAPTDSLLRALGIDDLSIGQVSGQTAGQATGDGRETVIRLGKQLSRNWYAGYERGVNATAGTFQLIYRVAQRFTLRAQSGLENSLDLIWTWRFEQSPLSGTKRAPP
jgi:glyoxylase-like metal-dependent hydrolase (beta-lactamase superfamily II)